MRLRLIALAAAAALVFASGAEARRSRHARHSDQPGDFDFYILTLSIAPSFCALSGTAEGRRQCDHPSGSTYRETPLTIHGLWPNDKGRSVNLQPQYCSKEPLPPLPQDLTDKLRRYMPGIADDLADHEWSRHGTCSGLLPTDYFSAIATLAEHANATIGEAIRENDLFGKQVSVADLLAAIGQKDAALAQAIVVDCKFAKKSRTSDQASIAYIDEIRVILSKDLTPAPNGEGWPGSFLPVTSVGFRSNSGCPGGAGFLPAGYAAQ